MEVIEHRKGKVQGASQVLICRPKGVLHASRDMADVAIVLIAVSAACTPSINLEQERTALMTADREWSGTVARRNGRRHPSARHRSVRDHVRESGRRSEDQEEQLTDAVAQNVVSLALSCSASLGSSLRLGARSLLRASLRRLRSLSCGLSLCDLSLRGLLSRLLLRRVLRARRVPRASCRLRAVGALAAPAAAAAAPGLRECAAKNAPWRSTPVKIQSPPGTSIGPCAICAPRSFAAS